MAGILATKARNAVGELHPGNQFTSTETGTGIDISGYWGEATIVLSMVGGGTSRSAAFAIQECSDAAGTGAAALGTNVLNAQFTTITVTTPQIQVRSLKLPQSNSSGKKFIRSVMTVSGTGPTLSGSMTIILPGKHITPV